MRQLLRFITLPLLCLLLLCGCEKDKYDAPAPAKAQDQLEALQMQYWLMDSINAAPQRSSQEALAIAKQILHQDPNRRALRGEPELQLDYIVNNQRLTRGSKDGESLKSIVDTLFYIVNVGDNEGFMILSGDRRLPQDVLAITEKGKLLKDSLPIGSPVMVFLSRLPIYCEQRIAEFEHNLDSIKNGIMGWEDEDPEYAHPGYGHPDHDPENPGRSRPPAHRIKIDDYLPTPPRYYTYWGPWKEITRSEVLVPVNWGQRAPFNNYAPIKKGERCVAGCTAVAVAQIMAAHQHPNRIFNHDLNWELLTREKGSSRSPQSDQETFNDQVAWLLRTVGKLLRNYWGLEETGCTGIWARQTFKDFGYYCPAGWSYYDKGKTLESLSQRKPVLMSGFEERVKFLFFPIYKGGHSWVVDGTLVRERKLIRFDTRTGKRSVVRSEQSTLLHCNWGWNGGDNGYFEQGVFNSKHPIIEDASKSNQPNSEGKDSYYFLYEVRNMPYISK